MSKPILTVVKIGGNVIDHKAMLLGFLETFASIPAPKVLIHGGGKVATQVSAEMGITAKMVNGRRITDANTLRIVTMVYGGLLNKQIVAGLQAFHCPAIGMTGADGNIIQAHKRQHPEIDFGYVGDVDQVNGDALNRLLSAGFCPVIAPLTHDGQGTLLNTNADTIAAETAIALSHFQPVRFVYCFEKKGLLTDITDENSVVAKVALSEIETLKANGTISDGMIPKVDNIAYALRSGVSEVLLCHAEDLSGILSGKSIGGTIFTKE